MLFDALPDRMCDMTTSMTDSEGPAFIDPMEFYATCIGPIVDDSDESAESQFGSKPDRDLAFAVSLLRSGHVTERKLSESVAEFTAFGPHNLSDYLVAANLISQDTASGLSARVSSLLQGISERLTRDGSASQAERERMWLSQLDPSGRISRMLGIADASMLSADEIEGRCVGARYTLLRKLGQGGLGIVWLARDENLERYVALKEISGTVLPGDPSLDHFRREAQITGRLEHPGIVPVYQFGEDDESGKSFYAMRFLGKRTLQDALVEYHERRNAGSDCPLVMLRMLTAFVNVCHAVGHAHSRQVIHRDLKPENIALDDFGQVTVLDWGLAMISAETGLYEVNGRTEPADLRNIGSTHSGRVLGTPLFMAPEQAAGRLDEVSELTDVFGLGGILYAILTGSAPHQAAVESRDSGGRITELLSTIVSGQIASPNTLRRNTPPELNAVCMKALSKKSYLRYASATDLADDVQRYMAGSSVTAYESPLNQRLRQRMAAYPIITHCLMLLSSLILIGGAAIGYTVSQGREALQEARYHSVEKFAQKLKVSMGFETQELVRDVRFITDLPLMKSMIRAHQASADPVVREPNASVFTAHDAGGYAVAHHEEWMDRQSDLFEGLLEANPAYLKVGTCRINEDQSIREMVCSERLSAGKRSHRTPTMQLLTRIPDAANSAESAMLTSLRPGEVLLVTNDQLSDDVPVDNRSPLVVSGVAAAFDQDGALFGLNLIELDLRPRLKEIVQEVVPENVSVDITDVSGRIALRYRDGEFTAVEDMGAATFRHAALRSLFDPETKNRVLGDGKTYYATLVELCDRGHGKATVGILAYLD